MASCPASTLNNQPSTINVFATCRSAPPVTSSCRAVVIVGGSLAKMEAARRRMVTFMRILYAEAARRARRRDRIVYANLIFFRNVDRRLSDPTNSHPRLKLVQLDGLNPSSLYERQSQMSASKRNRRALARSPLLLFCRRAAVIIHRGEQKVCRCPSPPSSSPRANWTQSPRSIA